MSMFVTNRINGNVSNSKSLSSQNIGVNESEDSKQRLLKIITIPNIVKFIKKCGAKQTNSFALSVQLRKNHGSPTDIKINAWPSAAKNQTDVVDNANIISSNSAGKPMTTIGESHKPPSYHYYIHGSVKDAGTVQYQCGVYLDMDLLKRRFALFGCECQLEDKTPGRACEHTLALLSYVREKLQHLPYNFVNNNEYNNENDHFSGSNDNDKNKIPNTPVLHESYFKITHISTQNELFIPRNQDFNLGRLEFGKGVPSLYNDAHCSRKQLLLKHCSISGRFTLTSNRVMNHPRVYPLGFFSYFFIVPPLYTIELMNDFYFSMYFGQHLMKVEQFYKVVKPNNSNSGIAKRRQLSPSTTMMGGISANDNDNDNTNDSMFLSITTKTSLNDDSNNDSNNDNKKKTKEEEEKTEKILNELECPICCELLYKPVSITCLHKFCESCWYSWALTSINRKDQVRCPTCREETMDYIPRLDKSTASICNMMFPKEYNERKDDADQELVNINKTSLQEIMDELKTKKGRKKKRRKITGYFGSSDGAGNNDNGVIDLS
jgi:hypothetical protein